MLPSVDVLLDGPLGFAVPLRMRFRGTDVREGLLLRGPAGWGEFAPFPEYGPDGPLPGWAATIQHFDWNFDYQRSIENGSAAFASASARGPWYVVCASRKRVRMSASSM